MSVTADLLLPRADGRLEAYVLAPSASRTVVTGPARSRVVYAAAHVVADPWSDTAPGAPAVLDWEATLAQRHHLWTHGLGVADAMDTAQRGAGLDWPATAELIRRSAAEARSVGGSLVVGVNTDQLPAGEVSLGAVRDAYLEQLGLAEDHGCGVVLMASRQLARAARHAEDYLDVYGTLIRQASRPVLLHWLGGMFDPALAGYWGSTDLDEATRTVLALVAAHPGAVEGIKLSLLDAGREIALRRALPDDVRLYTGDDFHYPELILGDDEGHSDALLGVLDAIAPAAAEALQALDVGDVAGYRRAFAPTVPLARLLFAAPTFHYKTGLTFLAWLAGRQQGFAMVGGHASARSAVHLAEVFRLADVAGLLPDRDLAVARMRAFLTVTGVTS